jgi:hypothetical protein
MINIINNKRVMTFLSTITVILLLSTVVISNNFNFQIAAAQKASDAETFSAKGYTGQTFVLPSGMMPTPPATISQFNLLPPVGSIIAGNWSFAVKDGKLQNFNWKVEFMALNGKVNGTSSITGVTNVTGAVLPITTNNSIQLSKSNSTIFKANADINVNGKTAFRDVPIVFSLLKGRLVNLSIDPAKTEGLFSTPLFAIVTSLAR